MNHLTMSVNACIRTPGAVNFNGSGRDRGQGALHGVLNGGYVQMRL